MSGSNRLVRKIQSLSAQEATTQPSAADWLWEQDKGGKESVHPNDRADLAFWARVLSVSEEELKHAIVAVGTSADAIRMHLSRKLDRPHQ